MGNELDFEEMINYYYDKPVEFAEDFLNFKADDKQREIMESIRENKRTAVRSGQGIGKTATVACIIIWYLCTRYNAKILATAPNITQLYTVLWAELAKWLQVCPLAGYLTQTKTRLYMNDYEKTWFAFPKTATSAEGIAGQHADHLLIIADEASGIKDDILETLLGTITGAENKLLFISNPTRRSGVFFDAFHQNAALFETIHVNAEQSIRVDRENIDMLAKSYGKDSNVYRVRVLGQFPTAEDDVFINIDIVETAINLEKEQPEELEYIKIGVDVARFGNDDTVLAINTDQAIRRLLSRHGNDTTMTCGNVLLAANQERSKYRQPPKVIVIVDDTGIGGGVTDQLRAKKREMGLDWLYIIPLNMATGIGHIYYADITTYLWASVRELLQEGELELPNNSDMIGQLTARKYYLTGSGKIKLESKDDMKARGIKSPDIADAITLSCYPIDTEKLFYPGRRKKKACQANAEEQSRAENTRS